MKSPDFRYSGGMKENRKNFSPVSARPGIGEMTTTADGDAGESGPEAKMPQKTGADLRRERAAAKLRENLQRRKQQSRARRAGAADEATGLPAAKLDESS
ncbi:hypothetical protein DEM27_00545 [Metarhizobium album]|uniref:Uncharacterized protein n=1 Tax=Metarhizobium album TaxID=2182425 RepID=A0A2U2DWN7_9HYPH|nr:hypothetical protein [Rhizobium album]PWE57733.1 hypothetical protein DEM27_00545 [Rhizobium album]